MSSGRRSPAETRRHARRRPSGAFSVIVLGHLGSLAIGLLSGCALISRQPDLAAQIAAARTPGDHLAIARSLLAQASGYATAAAYHRGLAAKYQNLAQPGAEAEYRIYDSSDLRMAEHCRKVAEDLERAASDLTQLAHEHEQLAKILEGTEK